MKIRNLLLPLICAGFINPAAAFDFGSIDLGKVFQTVKKVQQATSDID